VCHQGSRRCPGRRPRQGHRPALLPAPNSQRRCKRALRSGLSQLWGAADGLAVARIGASSCALGSLRWPRRKCSASAVLASAGLIIFIRATWRPVSQQSAQLLQGIAQTTFSLSRYLSTRDLGQRQTVERSSETSSRSAGKSAGTAWQTLLVTAQAELLFKPGCGSCGHAVVHRNFSMPRLKADHACARCRSVDSVRSGSQVLNSTASCCLLCGSGSSRCPETPPRPGGHHTAEQKAHKLPVALVIIRRKPSHQWR
jgi:hypothetical protein